MYGLFPYNTHRQDILNYCLCGEDSFDLDAFLEVWHAYKVHVQVNFSLGLVLRTLNDDGSTTNRYFHSSHNNGVMLPVVFRVASDDNIIVFKDLF